MYFIHFIVFHPEYLLFKMGTQIKLIKQACGNEHGKHKNESEIT